MSKTFIEITAELKSASTEMLKSLESDELVDSEKEMSSMTIGDIVAYKGKEYEVVGLSTMVYDDDCTGEPEWKITHEIQEVAIADIYDGITFQKPAWLPVSDIKSATPEEGK